MLFLPLTRRRSSKARTCTGSWGPAAAIPVQAAKGFGPTGDAVVLFSRQRKSRQSAHARSGTMAQLSYDEIRLLRELKNSERRISGNKLDVGLERLVKEGYATTDVDSVAAAAACRC